MAARTIKDDYGVVVTAGCTVGFSYGIPPVHVEAKVIERGGRLIALTPGHNPAECPVASLRRHVGGFWVV
jgi:hypothetical protein